MGSVSKGTSSFGRRGRKTVHLRCRRCGRRAYHVTEKRCAACGYGATTKLKRFAWQTKTLQGERYL
ncbi:MAG: 50S ribosomal protein L37e [Candidatus Bathyarchaeia archaeon]